MTSTQNTARDIFWLSRYAYNKTAPLFAKARVIEPTTLFAIEMMFAEPGAKFFGDNSLEVKSWWGREGMFQLSPRLRSEDDVDRFADTLAADVAALQPVAVAA